MYCTAALADTNSIDYITDLELGSLWVWTDPLQPEDLAGLVELLPPRCMEVVQMKQGSLIKVSG
jgi:hypothetical protein